MAIGFTGGGASQDQIADGADESDGRWLTVFNQPLTGSSPSGLTTGGAGAVPTFSPHGATMDSGTDGDHGHLGAGAPGLEIAGATDPPTLALICRITYSSAVAIGNLTADHLLGVGSTGDNPNAANDTAGFYPTAGDSTSGNVYVDDAGAETNGSINYPALSEQHVYTVLLDYGGFYLTAGHTGFYVDGDPRKGDTADADLAAVPSASPTEFFGAFFASEGANNRMGIGALEVAVRQ